MEELAYLAKKYSLPIQSHISENVDEVKFAAKLFPDAKNYADIYDKCNLLTNKCVMAHGVHLTDEELYIFRDRKVSVGHCPNSNTNLQSGLCDVKRLMEHDITVGLGTDISGGNRISILDSLRAALDVSHHLNFVKKQYIQGTGQVHENAEANRKYIPLNYKEGLYLATLGGSKALSLENNIGNFVIGKDFDALLVDINVDPIDSFNLPSSLTSNLTDQDKFDHMLQKFVYVGDDRNILEVYVNGRSIKI